MSSVGQGIGGVVGAIVGFFTPIGPVYGAQIGMMIGGAIDPPKGPTINGPRLSDLSVQTSTYGVFIPRNYGTMAQVGNVFWVQGDKLIEVITSTSSGGKGGPQTKTNTASYYATFAVGLCEGPIDGVRRIWIGNQLWYDAGSSDVAAIIASNASAQNFTLYLGTDTQLPDPLIQADKGAANVPAYRGLAYLVFDRLPLAAYSNSLLGAQVKVEIVKSGTVSNYLAQIGNSGTGLNPRYVAMSGDYAYAVSDSIPGDGGGALQVFNIANPHANPQLVGSVDPGNTPTTVAVSGNYAYVTTDDIYRGHKFSAFGIGGDQNPQLLGSTTISADSYDLCIDGNYAYLICNVPSLLEVVDITYPSVLARIASISTGLYPTSVRVYSGHAFVACNGAGVVQIYDVSNPATPTLVGSMATGAGSESLSINGGYLYLVNYTSGMLQVFDLSVMTTPAVIGSVSIGTSSNPRYVKAVGNYAYVVDTGGNLTLVDVSVPTAPTIVSSMTTAASPSCLDVAGVKIAVVGFDDTLRIVAFTDALIASTAAVLGDIVQAECLTSKLLTAAYLDVTELTDSVRGYRVTQLGAIRGSIDPLRAAWPFDVVQHGYKIKFKRRGSASVATIASTELDARAAGDAPGVQITTVREMDSVLPRRVSVNYVDVTREYDVNQQYAERLNTDAVSEKSVDLPIVFNATEGAQKAETLLYMYWMERYDVSLRLPPTYAQLEPGDVITVTSPDADYELRLTSINTLPDGRLECAAKFNQAALYMPTAIGEEGASTGGLLTLDGPCVYSLLDIPLLRDDDDTAGFAVSMAGHLSGWPGGVLYRSDDAGQTWSDLRGFTPGATIGYATTSLSAHGGTVYDFASTLTVKLYSGTLASVTEAQIAVGQNWFAYGADGRWEIIAARTVTLQVDGSYLLQDFLRGQQGTEWATGLHAANDRLVLLDTANMAFVSVNSSTIGAARDYRAITTGKAIDSDSSLAFTYRGVNLECLSPVGLTGNRHPTTSDWTLTWIRRSRMPGWYDLVDVPLGETSESYEIDVYSDATYTTVKRTLTAATPTVAYTSAQQVTDFAGNQATLYLKLYQLSATVGRGYALTQSITR